MPQTKPSATDVERVFDAWTAHKKHPERCIFTEERRELIAARLRLGYSADHLITVIDYANNGDEDWPRWMRGRNPRKKAYLDLENLLVRKKLGKRVEEALGWLEQMSPSSVDGAGVDLGPTGRFR